VALFWILLAGGCVAAAVDWFAAATSDRRLEYAAKPAVLVALTLAAAAIPADRIDLADRRWWFVAALACCLVGDVLLMLPRNLFVPGLVAFLAGHVLFIVGFLQPPEPPGSPPFTFSVAGLAVAAVAVVAAESAPGVAVIRSLARRGQQALALAAAGAVLFLVSDTVLAVDRFVRPVCRGRLAVHVTYHLAQGLFVVSLLR
jgi:uncharacterized membrane protein YhhN